MPLANCVVATEESPFGLIKFTPACRPTPTTDLLWKTMRSGAQSSTEALGRCGRRIPMLWPSKRRTWAL